MISIKINLYEDFKINIFRFSFDLWLFVDRIKH